jgi:hypothetical protein
LSSRGSPFFDEDIRKKAEKELNERIHEETNASKETQSVNPASSRLARLKAKHSGISKSIP